MIARVSAEMGTSGTSDLARVARARRDRGAGREEEHEHEHEHEGEDKGE
eukprot:CAMPEP_0177676266 /NCGR_PEP_ID=MMETSP0447-20121125/27690_1 /TAXON_ID=0 /ORGANISM="Stygamoeba regulata, Strain BSH-02190019" /LENGTH=48 /DNA_ID= /DNA_START= /DNA_END= /DNA_ORIENTATION=